MNSHHFATINGIWNLGTCTSVHTNHHNGRKKSVGRRGTVASKKYRVFVCTKCNQIPFTTNGSLVVVTCTLPAFLATSSCFRLRNLSLSLLPSLLFPSATFPLNVHAKTQRTRLAFGIFVASLTVRVLKKATALNFQNGSNSCTCHEPSIWLTLNTPHLSHLLFVLCIINH